MMKWKKFMHVFILNVKVRSVREGESERASKRERERENNKMGEREREREGVTKIEKERRKTAGNC